MAKKYFYGEDGRGYYDDIDANVSLHRPTIKKR